MNKTAALDTELVGDISLEASFYLFLGIASFSLTWMEAWCKLIGPMILGRGTLFDGCNDII